MHGVRRQACGISLPAAFRLGLAVLVLCWSPVAVSLAAPTNASGRNILLIIADDLGQDASSLYPVPLRRPTTPAAPAVPNLTALARQGILFSNFWATPSCSPTRATIFTGRYGFRTGVGKPIPPGRDRSSIPSLSLDEFGLPKAFTTTERGRAYLLAMMGKWHLSTSPADPNKYGWPYFAGPDPTSDSGAGHDFFNWPKVVNGSVQKSTIYATTDVVNEAIGKIIEAKAQNRPFFLWVAFNAVHSPFHRPPDDLYPPPPLPATGASDREYFEAMVKSLDSEVGRLLASVDLARTTVIFLGDNGTPNEIVVPPYDPKHAKLTIYEDSIRVPLLIAGAGVAAPGRILDDLVQSVDIYPTILDLAGIDLMAAIPLGVKIDGISLLSLLATDSEKVPIRQFAYSEQFGRGDYAFRFERALRDHQFKLIERSPELTTPKQELYDLEADPFEQSDLLAGGLRPDLQQRFDELHAAMVQLLETR